MAKKNGRPATSDEQFKIWLEELRPHLVKGCSLRRALELSGLLEGHETVIRDKYHLNDWFSRKIDAYRSTPGEKVNEAFVGEVEAIWDKQKTGARLSKDEIDTLEKFAKLHRTAQPFFVTRTETAVVDDTDLGKIKDILEGDYDNFTGEENSTQTTDGKVAGQEVADDTSVQNKE